MTPLLVTHADFANLSLLGHAPLQRLLEHATVVASDAMPADVVTMNSRVVLRDVQTGERRTVCVVYPPDADPAKALISVLTPTGMALLGATPGGVIECEERQGARVEEVLHQPEHSLRTHLFVRG